MDQGPSTRLTRRLFLQRAALTGTLLSAPVLRPATVRGQGAADASGPTGPLTRVELASGWRLKSVAPQTAPDPAAAMLATGDWLTIPVMPAMVHDVLLSQRKIEEPWLPDGTERCLWVAERDWVYATSFAAPAGGTQRLRFQGLGGRVTLYLNGEQLASHDDYLPFEIDVSGRLRPENSLVLQFQAKARTDKDGKPQRPERSARGSYLGPNPTIAAVGIFDKIFVESSAGHIMQELFTGSALDESLTQGTVTVEVTGVCAAPAAQVRLRLLDPAGAAVAESTTPATVSNCGLHAQCAVTLDRPALWWPRGYGAQPLYRAEVSLLIDGQPVQTEQRTIGFRRITMPELLHFAVNGVPVLILGGAWVTPNLMSDVWDPAREERLFALAENANFNGFRIWGSVEAPQDAFYEMADARGFLLWQDCTKLPLSPKQQPNPQIREQCLREAAALVRRLKHHPSVLCWNGCNEFAMWAHEDYDPDLVDHGPWPTQQIAEEVGTVCKQLDPDRHYQPSSPYYGMNPNDPREGNTHGYTNMWFVPGYDYLNFASEDTRIAAPPLHSLKRFMRPEDLWPEGYTTLSLHGNRYPFPESWMPYTTAESWKKTGPVEQFYDAADPAGLVYRFGMAEALYYQDTVERQRRGRPATEAGGRRCCGGYIVWKYNDSWPQVYSAKVDYFLEPYHAYYALRRAYAPLLLSFDIDKFIHLWAVNDTTEPVGGTVKIQLYHLEKNEFRKEIVREVTVAPGQSLVVSQLDKDGIRSFRREHILFATLTGPDGQVLARANALADIERRLTFPDARLRMNVVNGALEITTDRFARCINLEGDANGDPFGWFFEDNYFDLLPGETKIVRILGDHAQGRIRAKAWYSPEVTAIDWQKSV